VVFSIVKQAVEPMTPETAVEEMEAADHSFLAYLDRDNNQIQIVFRRSDDTFGIVQPVRKSKR
jgi:putative sigma-54 modulation protein